MLSQNFLCCICSGGQGGRLCVCEEYRVVVGYVGIQGFGL